MLGESERATELYWQAIQLDPSKGDLWFDLGTSYLQQVESDASLMTSAYGDSAYVKLRSAEVLAEEGKLIDAEEAYKAAIAYNSAVPCRLRSSESRCCVSRRLPPPENNSSTKAKRVLIAGWRASVWRSCDAASGNHEAALNQLATIANSDPAFVRSNLPLFRGAVAQQIK